MRCIAGAPLWLRTAAIGVVLCLIDGAASAQAAPFDCSQRCGVEQEGADPHLIVGVVDAVAGEEQGATLFQTMRLAKRWLALPEKFESFRQSVQPVSVRLPAGRSYTVLISQQEAHAAPLKVGDFVRYAPHRGINEKPPTEAEALAYWNVIGCIAILCRSGDSRCIGGYRAGIYRATDGTALALDGQRTDPTAPSIDPQSMRPR